MVEEPDAERGGAFWHRRGIFRGPSHTRDVEMRPGNIVDKALEKLRAEDASAGPTAADIFHIGRIAVDLAVLALSEWQPPNLLADGFTRFDQPVGKLIIVREQAGMVMA